MKRNNTGEEEGGRVRRAEIREYLGSLSQTEDFQEVGEQLKVLLEGYEVLNSNMKRKTF